MDARRHTRWARIGAAALATGALVTAGLGTPAQAQTANGQAHGHHKGHCRTFHATGLGTDNGDGTTSATLYRGTREVGTSAGALVPGATVEGVLSFTGTIVLTTDRGVLEAVVAGGFDTVTGEFAARSTELDVKGPYRSARGKLRLTGVQDLLTGEFTEVVHARICVPKKKQH